MNFPDQLKYTEEHEWARQDGNEVAIGITDHAQTSLGDIVFVELPEVGREVNKGDTFGVVESIKAVSDLYAPISGKVTAVNEALNDDPATINQDPYENGWIVKIEASNAGELDGLMDVKAYQSHVEASG